MPTLCANWSASPGLSTWPTPQASSLCTEPDRVVPDLPSTSPFLYAVASFLSLDRIHAFARRLTLGNKATLWTRNTYVKGMLLLEALSLLTGVMTYTSVLKAPTYIDIIEAIQVPNNFPKCVNQLVPFLIESWSDPRPRNSFLAFQVISNFLRLSMIGFQAVQITIDFRRVRRINTTMNPVTRATQEVLDAMFAVHCRNWVILVCRFPLAHPSLTHPLPIPYSEWKLTTHLSSPALTS